MATFRLKSDVNAVLENSTAGGNVLQNDTVANQVTQIKSGSGTYVPVSSGGVTIQGVYGTLTIMPDGSYSYTADHADRLRAGATATDSFTYTAVGGTKSGSTTLKFPITGINDAPTLTSTSETLTRITEDQITNGGQTVASFLHASDVDSSALKGVAITGLASGNGHWEYSINGGTNWSAVGTVADGSALLLRSTDYIRFVPNGADGTTATFTYHAWDQTSGTAGAKVDATIDGGDTAFSIESGTATISVTAINDAPVGVASSGSGTTDGPPITGQVQATDVDSTTLTYALVPNSVVGGSVSIDPATGNYTFTPTAGFSGTASFQFTANDGSLTSAATTATIAVTNVNDAPVLTSATATLASITEDQTTNGGQTVASFLQSTDADANALAGVAITGLDSGNGQWQFSTNGGTSWTTVGTVNDGSALLLRSTDYVRFVPNGVDGTAADFAYHAWDQTTGTAGTKADATVTGGQSAFSTDAGTASITVTAIDDAPVGVASSASGTENGPPITGQVQATDVDSTTLTYAVVANSVVGGSVTVDSATGNYTFTPTTGFSGSASFQFTASDGSLTSTPTTATIAIVGINDAPVLTSTTATLTSINEDQATNTGQTIASFLQSTDGDANALSGVAITGLDSGNGQWQFSTNGGTSWSAVGTVAGSAALLLRSTDYIRFVPNGVDGTSGDFSYHAWDQTSGTAGTTADATITGNQTAFSTETGTASITVTAVDDAPVGVASSGSGTEDGGPITGQVQATDVDSATLTYALVPNSAVGGSVSIDAATGNYSFTPAQNFNGNASFQFTANDGSLTSAATAVTLAISGVNDAPVAVADSGSTTQGVSVLLNVLANDTDVDGNPLTITGVGSAANGSVQIENGQVRYSPNSGYAGSDAFSYSIADGQGGTAVGNVSVNVTAAAPATAATSVTFRQGTAGYTGAVDTMLREHYPSDNYSNAFVVSPEGEDTKHTQGLLQFGNLFGTGPGQIPVGATIVSATLTLMTTQPSTDAGTINPMLVSWSNSSTWNSLGSGVQIGTEASSSNVVAIGAVTVGVHSYDVSGSVQAWVSAGTTASAENAANHGWLFNLTGTDFWNFTSSEGDVKPVLSITYVPAGSPAPATLPTVSISAPPTNVPQMENSGKTTFTLTLSQAATQDVTVTYSTADGTAKAGSDYTATTGTVTFHAGETVKQFDVSLINDGTAERVENLTAQITSVTGAAVATATADGHITDDDVVVAPFAPLNATIVHSYNLSNGSVYQDGSGGTYGISDPSGIAWIPSLNQFFIADSEHDESPFNSTINMFALHADGSYVRNYSLEGYTKEPTGLAYDPNNGFMYISDDSKAGVFWVDPLNPTVKLGFFDTKLLGYQDTEDLKIDPLTGHIHELDGELMQMMELTTTGQFVDSVPLPSVMKDAEALAYDPRHDVYFVSSGHETNHNIYVIDPLGHLLDTISVLSPYSGVKVKGLELAPSSDPNDGNQLSLYVADYGADQVNDGRLWEIHLGPDWIY